MFLIKFTIHFIINPQISTAKSTRCVAVENYCKMPNDSHRFHVTQVLFNSKKLPHVQSTMRHLPVFYRHQEKSHHLTDFITNHHKVRNNSIQNVPGVLRGRLLTNNGRVGRVFVTSSSCCCD